MNAAKLEELLNADLRKSGIPLERKDALGLRVLDERATAAFMKDDDFEVPTYEIPYFDLFGDPIGYSRLKNLEETREFGPVKARQRFKYLQKPNSPPHLYIPPGYFIVDEVSGKVEVDTLVITEGEKKAIKACECDIPCVALGGVDSFRSSKRGIVFLPEFEDCFKLDETNVEICFDSDVHSNERVLHALNQLSIEIGKRAKSVSFVRLDADTTGDGKQGLDDFLAGHKSWRKAQAAWDRLPRDGTPTARAFADFNSRLAWDQEVGRLYNIERNRYYDGEHTMRLEFANQHRVIDPFNPKRQIPAINLWKEFRPPYTTIKGTVYRPGAAERIRDEDDEHTSINLWRPPALKPDTGSADMWLDLVKFVIGKDQFNWFLQWLAYPLQYQTRHRRGIKMLQAVFVWSEQQGVGKNFIIEPFIEHIYGPAFQKIGTKQLESDFNDWAVLKQFVLAEEVYLSSPTDRKALMGELNNMITSPTVELNKKFQPLRTFDDYRQFYFCSNHEDALTISRKDRRFLVIHAPETKKSASYYRDLNTWAEEKNGAAKVLHYLMEKVKTKGFNPKADAPYTDEKREAIISSQNVVEQFTSLLRDAPHEVFEVDGALPDKQLWTSTEITRALNEYIVGQLHGKPIQMPAVRFGRLMERNGIKSQKIWIGPGTRVRLYPIFERRKWRKEADQEQWRKHYRRHTAALHDADLKEKQRAK